MKSNTVLQRALYNPACIKLSALLIGYSLWFYLGQYFTSSQWVQVPLCFYSIPAQMSIKAPETVWIELTGKRIDIRHLDLRTLALHVNAQAFKPGKQNYTINYTDLFLPSCVRVSTSRPNTIAIELVPT